MTMLKTSLYENQKFNHNELIKRRRALLVDKAGNGKCKGGIARIQTSEGLIKFEDLLKDAPYGVSRPKRAITVSTRNGVKRITHFYKEANCKLNYVTFTNGTITTGTDDHPILVLKNNEVVFIKMKNIKLGDYVAFSKEPTHVYTESSADFTYQTFLSLGKLTVNKEYSDLSLQGLKESLEYDSSLPKDVWKGSVAQKKYFIKGLIIAGGSIRDTTIEIKLPDRRVACDVASIALSIGLNIMLIDTSVIMVGHSIESMSEYFLQKPIDEDNIKYTHGLDKLMNTFDYSRQPTIPLIYNNELALAMDEYSYENTPVMMVSEYNLLKLGKHNPLYKLTEYTYHQVTQKESTIEDVYDVTVQDVHEFLSDGIINHNTLSCLAAFATLKEHKKLDIMIVLTPLNAYKKLVWKNDAASKTMLKTVDIEVLHKRYEANPTKIRQVVETFDVIYAKHSHVRQIPEMFQMLTQEFKTLVVFDEVHAFKNPNSVLTIRAKYALQRAYAIWSLTATPLSRNMEDTYNIVNFTYPWFLGPFHTFKKRFCIVAEKVVGRLPNGGLRKVEMITGVSDEEGLKNALAPILIQGTSEMKPEFHFVDYTPSDEEYKLYRRIAAGIDIDEGISPEQWLEKVLTSEVEEHPIKEVKRFSSRFIYLQTAADGVLSERGTQDRIDGVKTKKLIEEIKKIVSKKESVLVYFDFYSSLEVVERMLYEEQLPIKILKSTGASVLLDTDLTEASVKNKPHVVLCTRAASESSSYYFINNVILFHIPTTPSTFAQMVGRITRKNTLFLNNLHVHIFRSDNIDLYKLIVISIKAYQMELVSGKECSIPDHYKGYATQKGIVEKLKKLLLWER